MALKGTISDAQYILSEKEPTGDVYSISEEEAMHYLTNPGVPYVPYSAPNEQANNTPPISNPISAETEFFLPSDSSELFETADPIPEVLSEEYIDQINDFGLRFLDALPLGDSNVSFSPANLYMLLSMMLSSADETAASAIRTTINSDLSITALGGYASLLTKSLDSTNVDMGMMMILNTESDKDDVFEEKITQKPVERYEADWRAYNYSMTHYVISEINRWMNSYTDGKIPVILHEEVDTATEIALYGGFCVDPMWDSGFTNAQYCSDTFTSANQVEEAATMITTQGVFKEQTYNEGILVAIPANANRLTVVFGKAPSGVSAYSYASNVLSGNLSDLLANMPEKEINFSIPRIDSYAPLDCKNALISLGFNGATKEGKGHFAKMTIPEEYTGLPSVSSVNIGTAVVINENSRSDTLVSISETQPEESGMLTPESAVLKMNSPYFVAVLHNETQCLISLSIINTTL